jgi:hypothetical protein
MTRMTLIKSPNRKKKWRAVFRDDDGEEHHTDFGDATMSDYTQHHDKLRRENYLSRHRSREAWSNPQSAGALSRWLLWGDSTSLQTNLSAFKRRFSLA